MKPLFIPLMSQYYEAFLDGAKDTEYRLYGPVWNERNCQVGRAVTLSKGYGKKHRLSGVVTSFARVTLKQVPRDVEKALDEIYGENDDYDIAAIGIKVILPDPPHGYRPGQQIKQDPEWVDIPQLLRRGED
ncbi:hypothetical protein [uncultured Alcanivorax sp.]|uniref:hypothetical protein n=1 Tax=uncultured Alcanivorax sp. TaxID=191215 RepID=UPI0030D9035D